ncbi:hypothetical protein DUT91_13090 [Phyllobacterium salinisoli]|uniref:NADH-quinone oxidoreductase subunit E n=2 Tax=Phyllobacterium salinisoli TaxID=1899321 RepID=A0A368K436_9HYPH|nr:hypothetical protein DUT91_13090 [Phyllobacterium salinisoli]
MALKAARGGKPDNLTLIRGVGDELEKELNAVGIFHFDQIAAWTPAQIAWINRKIGFPGRIQRENWVSEAAALASGGSTDFTKRVEAGKVTTSHATTGTAKAGGAKAAAKPTSMATSTKPSPARKSTAAAAKPAMTAGKAGAKTGVVAAVKAAAAKVETAAESITSAKPQARKPAAKKTTPKPKA